MKILLINPPYLESVYRGVKKAVQIQMPLGMAYLAAVLEREKFPVEVLDANAEGLSIEETIEKICQSEAEIVGLTALTSLIGIVYKIALGVRERCNKKIIAGGIHVTFFPAETLKECAAVDIIVRGEGEETILELARKNFNASLDIKGISFRGEDNQIISSGERPRIENLDSLPHPARHMFPLKDYRPSALFDIGAKSKSAPIITSRGCPSRCRYCSSLQFWGPKIKFRSVQNIIDEIEYLVASYDIKQLSILDDYFLSSKQRASEFCDNIITKGIKIKWWCYSRLDALIEPELFRKMKRAGCYGLNFGAESGNQEILKRAQKNIDLNQVRQVIRHAKREGFLVMASFMVGLPGDNKTTVMETINFARELNPHIAQFCITTPFPGTELYQEALRKGWMKDVKSWDDVGPHVKTKFRNDELSSEEIYELYNLANKVFYLRPAYLFQLFGHLLRHPRQARGFFMAGAYMVSENMLRN
ncbi:MAG: radical SAM protein [Candidatus Omnitrophota bacterium]